MLPSSTGKNASLGELYRHLGAAGVRVPNGFAITADAYRVVLRNTSLDATLLKVFRPIVQKPPPRHLASPRVTCSWPSRPSTTMGRRRARTISEN
jgi:hypothetical protein